MAVSSQPRPPTVVCGPAPEEPGGVELVVAGSVVGVELGPFEALVVGDVLVVRDALVVGDVLVDVSGVLLVGEVLVDGPGVPDSVVDGPSAGPGGTSAEPPSDGGVFVVSLAAPSVSTDPTGEPAEPVARRPRATTVKISPVINASRSRAFTTRSLVLIERPASTVGRFQADRILPTPVALLLGPADDCFETDGHVLKGVSHR